MPKAVLKTPAAGSTSAGVVRCGTEFSVRAHAPHPRPGYRAAVTRVEAQDLARFEGEGGREAPEPARPYSEEPSKQ